MKFAVALLLFAAAASAEENRIIGGTAVPDDHMLFAAFLDFGGWLCSGTLVNETWVITAGHCVNGAIGATVDVYLGDHDQSRTNPSKPLPIASKRTIQHPQYKPNILNHDIGLIELSEPCSARGDETKIKPLRVLSEGGRHEGQMVKSAGWGLTEDGGQVSDILNEVVTEVMPHANCTAVYGNLTVGFDFCLNTTGKKGVCSGDSGGPTMEQDEAILYGVNSFVHIDGCESEKPHGICNVRAQKPFIETYVGGLTWIVGT